MFMKFFALLIKIQQLFITATEKLDGKTDLLHTIPEKSQSCFFHISMQFEI